MFYAETKGEIYPHMWSILDKRMSNNEFLAVEIRLSLIKAIVYHVCCSGLLINVNGIKSINSHPQNLEIQFLQDLTRGNVKNVSFSVFTCRNR